MSSNAPDCITGSCHCGRVRYSVSGVPFRVQDVIVCNCSVCDRKGYLHWVVPESAFALLPPSPNEGACTATDAAVVPADTATWHHVLTTYTFNTHTAKHMFCKTCGMHPFYRPRSHPHGYSVNARCFDDTALHDRIIAALPVRHSHSDGDNGGSRSGGASAVTPFDGRNWDASIEAIAHIAPDALQQ